METLVRATIVYWFLWLVVRGGGKRSLAELTPLDLVVLVILGDFVQQGVTQEDMSVTGALIAVSVFVCWTLLADALGRRSRTANRVFAGEPVVIVRGGRPLRHRLAHERISMEELEEAARQQGYGDLRDVEYAILETDGKFSFIPSEFSASERRP